MRIQIWKAGGASVTYDRKVKGKQKNRRLNVATRNKEDKIGVWESICEKLDQHELVVMIHQVFASYTHFQRVCCCGRINPTSQPFFNYFETWSTFFGRDSKSAVVRCTQSRPGLWYARRT